MVQRELPANLRAEQALLGAILTNNRAYDQCAGLLPEHFAHDVHREIFRVAQRRIEAGRKIDAVLLKSVVENTGLLNDVGGVSYLTHLLTCMVMIDGVNIYADVIRDCAARRNLIEMADELKERAYRTDLSDNDAAAIAAWGIEEIEVAAAAGGRLQAATMADAVGEAINQSEAARRGERRAIGLRTGIPSLDRHWGGIYPKSLEVIGARPKTGKTSLACQIARSVAADCLDQGEGCVGFFSLEMPKEHLGLVNLSSMTGIPADEIRRGITDTKLGEHLMLAQRQLSHLPIEIIDQDGMPLRDIIGECRSLKRRKKLRLAIIDHRNRIGRDEKYGTTLDWYQHITRRLKEAAKQLSIPIIVLIQIKREADGREDPRPRMSDLEYSGEQDADDIILLHRPVLTMGEFPQKREKETKEQCANRQAQWYAHRAEVKNLAEALFVKRRFGDTGTVPLHFDGPRTTFSDLPEDKALPPIQDLWSET